MVGNKIWKIVNKIKELLEEEIKEQGLLEGINKVYIGGKFKSPVKPPRFHIFFGNINNAHQHGAHVQIKTFEVFIVAVVNGSPEEAIPAAINYTDIAEKIVLVTRDLDLDFVHDIINTGNFPESDELDKPNMYASAVSFQVRFEDKKY